MTALRPAIVAAARAYLGVRWHHLGRGRDGLDCVGLVLAAYRDAGITLDDSPGPYARGHRGTEMLQHIAGQGRRVPLPEAREGDVLLFADGLYVAHVGIRSTWFGQPAVIHARVNRRRVYEEPLTGAIGDALRAAYRHPALED